MSLVAPDEQARLAKLAELSGRIREHLAIFQPIAERAKARFNVPIALVSVIDASAQIYLGNCGIDATSTPRDQTFCNLTIVSPTVMVVENTLADPRFARHPFVTGAPHLRFYAGAPITWSGDLRLGTVCLADARPRRFTGGDRMILEHLAALVVHQLSTLPSRPKVDQDEVDVSLLGRNDLASSEVKAWRKKSA